MAKNSLKTMFSDKGVFILTGIKLIVIPLICLFIFGLFINDYVIIGVMIYLIAMPAPALAAILAERYGADAPYASSVVLVTTAFSLITIPVIALFL